MNKAQLTFLEQLGERIPRLFDAIARGNVKSEFIVGVRTINSRQVRLKLVAEVVDPGSNPLATHGQAQPHSANPRHQGAHETEVPEGQPDVAADDSGATPLTHGEVLPPASARRRSRRR